MIQIDMPMPEACDVCPFNYDFCWCTAFGDYDNWEKYSDDWNENVCERTTRPEYCPLKEQEAVEPIPFFTETGAESPNYVICGHCKSIKAMMEKHIKQKYCHECGNPVKWK